MVTAGQVIIVSADKDFTDTLAEQVKSELKLACMAIPDKEQLKQHLDSALVIVTPEAAEEPLPCPVITVKHPPVRLQDVLDDIARVLQNQSKEEVKLGGGYSLEWRQKQLSHGGKSVALTDKEAQLLHCLGESKGQMVSKEHLLKTVWGFDEALDTHTLETHIYRLRGKFRELTGDESMIAATEGGYVLKNEMA